MVETILRNCISNSIKLKNRGGTINISAKREKYFVTIVTSLL
jgi:hypothetical protein